MIQEAVPTELPVTWPVVLGRWLRDLALDNSAILAMALLALVRAMGVTVRTGSTGLFFSFGRARREVPPGFQLLVPFLQKVVVLPTRARTVDLPPQRVATRDGLVMEVDCNLVYRIVDVRRAIVEVDDLEVALPRVLVLEVQNLLRGRSGAEILEAHELEEALTELLSRRVSPWGVVVERAGFTSIRPSARTLAVTQLAQTVGTRRACLERLGRRGAAALALPMAAGGTRIERRGLRAGRREVRRASERRRQRRVRQVVDEVVAAARGRESRRRSREEDPAPRA